MSLDAPSFSGSSLNGNLAINRPLFTFLMVCEKRFSHFTYCAVIAEFPEDSVSSNFQKHSFCSLSLEWSMLRMPQMTYFWWDFITLPAITQPKSMFCSQVKCFLITVSAHLLIVRNRGQPREVGQWVLLGQPENRLAEFFRVTSIRGKTIAPIFLANVVIRGCDDNVTFCCDCYDAPPRPRICIPGRL